MSTARQDEIPVLPAQGEVVGNRFEIIDAIGDGGMGYVYRAHDRYRQRAVALKLITPRYIGRPDREARFFREAQLGKRIEHHPHIVEILESGRLTDRGDWPFIAMELVEGRHLPIHLVLNGPMEPARAARLARQLASAVNAIHSAGVVHRDICTRNVLLQDHGIVLLDFSHAGDLLGPRVAAGEPGRLTQPNEMVGTYTNMAPEQARAEPPSPAMDVYAFGIVLFELLTADNPYDDIAKDDFLSLLEAGTVPTLAFPNDDVPRSLVDLVTACTERDPSLRPSMPEIVERLDSFLSAPVALIAARETAPAPGPGAPVGSDTDASPASATPAEDAKRWRWIALVAIMVAAMAVVFAALVLLREEPESVAGRVEDSGGSQPASDLPARVDADTAAPKPDAGAHAPVQPTPIDAGAHAPVQPTPIDAAADPDPPPSKSVAPVAPASPTTDAGLNPPVKVPRPSACDDEPARAERADLARDWTEVVRATKSPSCWRKQSARIELRARALLNLRRYKECSSLPQRYATPETLRIIKSCAAMISRGK